MKEDPSEPDQQPAELTRRQRIGRWLWRRPHRWFLFGIPAGGLLAFIIGIGSWISFEYTVKASSDMDFCLSCHEMKAFVYDDYYKESPHFSNRSGVRVECEDCHVPKEFFPKMLVKIRASLIEVPGHLTGRISTQEKFDAYKPEMAQRVIDRMRDTDSRECRNCHSYDAMVAELQGRQAQRRHSLEYRQESGETCIDCHQGVAHSLPEFPDEG